MTVLLMCCGFVDANAQVATQSSPAAPPMPAAVATQSSLAARPEPAAVAAPTSFAPALAIETLGGIAGAALGYGALLLTDTDGCGEDLSCTLRNAGAALLAGTVGAGIGTYAAGRTFATEPSGWGAVGGAVVGAAAVVGLDHVLGDMSDGTRVAVFALTHGVIAALGSRIGAALR